MELDATVSPSLAGDRAKAVDFYAELLGADALPGTYRRAAGNQLRDTELTDDTRR